MNPAQLLDQFDRISDAPDAIPRLRQFILDLAVRGKLAEQDPRDEPASELLKRIQEEKIRLVKAGRIKKLESFEPVEAHEIPFTLPLGWEVIRMGWLAEKLGAGSTPLGGKSVYQTEGVPFLRSQNVHDDGLRLDGVALIPRSIHERMSGTHVRQNDILLNITGASIGRCALVPSNFLEGNVSQHVAIMRLFLSDIRQFIHLSLTSPFFQKVIDDVQVGVSREGLSMQRLRLFPMLIPPLAEQQRIVAKVDELMALCDRLEAAQAERENRRDRLVASSLNRLNNGADPDTFRDHARFYFNHLPSLTTKPEHIQQLRQTILNLAVRGKLAEQLADKEAVHGDYLNEPTSEEFPASWRVLTFGRFCDIQGGNQPPKSQFIDELRPGYVRLFQIRDLGENPVPTYIPEGTTNRFCRKGEILIGRYGASIGKIFWAQDGAYNVALAKFIYPQNAFLPQFAFLILKSGFFQAKLTGATRSAQAGFNKGDLADIAFPLPPLAEQQRIVAKVDEMMALCDKLDTQLTITQTESCRLLESVLHEALAPAV